MGLAWSVTKRAMLNYNVENRAHKLMEKGGQGLAPRHPTEIPFIEQMANDPVIKKAVKEKHEQLNVNLRDVHVESHDPPPPPEDLRRNLPTRESEAAHPHVDYEFGIYEPAPEKVKTGHLTFREARDMMMARLEEFGESDTREIPKAFADSPAVKRVPEKQLLNMLQYFSPFEKVGTMAIASPSYMEEQLTEGRVRAQERLLNNDAADDLAVRLDARRGAETAAAIEETSTERRRLISEEFERLRLNKGRTKDDPRPLHADSPEMPKCWTAVQVYFYGKVESSWFELRQFGRTEYTTFPPLRSKYFNPKSGSECSVDADRESARDVAAKLGLPLLELDFVAEYWNSVFSALLEGYRLGRARNVDVLCNRRLKFRSFYERVRGELGLDAVATGHYAKHSYGDFLENATEQPAKLLRPADKFKDQTSFLSQIPQDALRRTMFPLGSLTKPQVREMATQLGLTSQVARRESRGICFIGKRDFPTFIDQYIEPSPGKFIDIDSGQTVGSHTGIHHFTVGQRLGLGGLASRSFVLGLDPGTRVVSVGASSAHPQLFRRRFATDAPVWIRGQAPERLKEGLNCRIRIQRGMEPLPASVCLARDGGLKVTSRYRLRAVSPGQYCVMYDGDECLGSAEIASTEPHQFS